MKLGPATATAERGFTRITSVRELPDGRLLLADYGENALYVVEWPTGAVRPIGRRGDGPREFRQIGHIVPLAGDSTLLTDAVSRRWHLLEGEDIVETYGQGRPMNRVLSLKIKGTDGRGRLLDVVGASWTTEYRFRRAADTLGVVLVADPLSEAPEPPLDTIARIGGPGPAGACGVAMAAMRRGSDFAAPGGGGQANRCLPMISEEQALLFPDGWVAIAYLDPYRVDWRAPDGQWSRGEPIAVELVPMSFNERCAAVQGWQFRGLGMCSEEDVEGIAWPEHLPPFLQEPMRSMSAPSTPTLFAAPDGKLVVRQTPTSWSLDSRYDLIDRSGRRVGQIDLLPNEAIVGFGASSVYTIRTDELDLQWLRRHPFQHLW